MPRPRVVDVGGHAWKSREWLAVPLSTQVRPLAYSDTGSPVIAGRGMGAGRVVLVAALDAWRWRAEEGVAWASGWQSLVRRLAADVPPPVAAKGYDSPDMAAFAYKTCSTGLRKFLGADESLAMRTVLSWAWFRPSEKAWDDGARWYRCDVVGGSEKSDKLLPLPETAQGLLGGRPDDRWLVCVQGPAVSTGVKVPCARPHDWRAVTTIKVGEPAEDYPGDRIVEVTTRDFCSKSVGAWLNYPVDFDFGYTWFHEPEWEAGNRRSVCWAKTPD